MRIASSAVLFATLALAVVADPLPMQAQNPDYPGYLGVYVSEGNGGMRISGFIKNTPAAELARQGDIHRNDTIIRLGGRSTRTLQELKSARNRIPEGKEAKMVLHSGGQTYHVWITRSEAVPADGLYGSAPGSAAPGGDRFSKGGKGEGDEGDFRDAGSGDETPNNNEGDFRDKN